MAPHATHSASMGVAAGPTWHRGHRGWREAVVEGARLAWYPLWLATAVGITCMVVELVTNGMPVLSIG